MMSIDRRSLLQGVAAVLSAAAITPVVTSQRSMAEIVGKAEGAHFPVGSIVVVSMDRAPPGYVFLEGQTLMAREFPELAACVGCGRDGAIRLQDYTQRKFTTLPNGAIQLRHIMRVA